MIDVIQQLSKTAAGRPLCTHSSGVSLYVLKGLHAISLKLDVDLHQSLSFSKDQRGVFVQGHNYQERDKDRVGKLGISWRWKTSRKRVGDAARNCSLELPPYTEVFQCAKVAGSFIVLQPPCSNNLPQATASFACAESWPGCIARP